MPLAKSILGSSLAVLLLVCAWAAWGDMDAGTGEAEGVKAEKVNKGQELKKVPAPVSTIRKAAEFVKKVEGGVLYTEGGRYSLSGVKVIDLTRDRKAPSTKRMPKMTAEMTFVDNQLREVVIRQRQ